MPRFWESKSLMHSETAKRVLEIAAHSGVLRPRDLDAHGIPRKHLNLLYHAGLLNRVGRGLYASPEADLSVHAGIVQAAKQVPHGIVCLLSALQFHEIGTQSPFEVWMAIGRKSWRPSLKHPPLRIVRFSGNALTEGVDEHQIDNVPVKVYNPAKTVADCFKYRNKIGLDVALEALKDCLQHKKCTHTQLWQYAKVCRVTKVMRPYLEAVS
jgi:predicted transcriptional regulator of viral defense system